MPRYSTAFGMDVHLRSTTVCALDAETGEAVTRRFRGNPRGEVAEWMSGFPGPSLAAYESGYLGFAPQRELSGSASTASSRPSPGSRGRRQTLVQERPQRRGRWPRRYCRTISPRYGCRPPRSRGSGTSPGPTTRRPRGSGGGEAAALGVPRRRGPTAARRRPATPGGTGRTASSGGSTGPARRRRRYPALAALRNEVEAADEAGEALLAEYRAAVAAGPSRRRRRGAPVDQGVRLRARRRLRVRRSATSRGSAPAGR